MKFGLLTLSTVITTMLLPLNAADSYRMGPGRNGVSPTGPALLAQYDDSIKPLWTSDGPMGKKGCGGGSPVYHKGHVYVYATNPYDQTAAELVVCMDAKTGTKLWTFTVAGKIKGYGNHCTPAVNDSVVVAGGSAGQLWCLDRNSGKELWSLAQGGPQASSPLIVDDLVICGHRGTRAFNISDGSQLWQSPGATDIHSPCLWQHQGTAYVIATSATKQGNSLQCLEAKTGKLVWKAAIEDGLKHATPAIHGDTLAIAGGKHLTIVQLSLSGIKRIHKSPDGVGGHGGAGVINSGSQVIAGTKKGAVCYQIQGDKASLLWRSQTPVRDTYSSPILADGKIFGMAPLASGTKQERTFSYPIYYARVTVLDAKTGTSLGSFADKQGICMVSPCIADGHLFVRGGKGISCYALTK